MTDRPEELAVDVATVGWLARRRWWWTPVGAVVGVLIGWTVVRVVPPRFTADAMVLIRSQAASGASLAGLAQGAAGGALGLLAQGSAAGAMLTDQETQLALLASRAVAGAVVDSLRLQVRLVEPARQPATAIVDSVDLPGRFKPRTVALTPGTNTLPEGTVWVRADAPATVRVRLEDREDAVTTLGKTLRVSSAGGDAVRVSYRARDSVSAAAVPNLAVAVYLERRQTVDRGLNQRRREFVERESDSVRTAFAAALAEARRASERSGEPVIVAAAEALTERLVALQAELAVLTSEAAAVEQLTREAASDPRRVAGLPALQASPTVSSLITQLSRLEEERTRLLRTLTPTSPAVRSVVETQDSLRAVLMPIALTYRDAVNTQRAGLLAEVSQLRTRLAAVPKASETVRLTEARVAQLAALDQAMGVQVLDARLAALDEGGDVRVIDEAMVPRRVSFPRPTLTLALGALMGLLAGAALALLVPLGHRP